MAFYRPLTIRSNEGNYGSKEKFLKKVNQIKLYLSWKL